MLKGDFIDIEGVTFHRGDMISSEEDGTFLVANTDSDAGEVGLYHLEEQEVGWLDAETWAKRWFQIQANQTNVRVWTCLGYETCETLVDGRYIEHKVWAHKVRLLDPPAGHPEETFCLSWDDDNEGLTYPPDGEYVKYRTFDDLATALQNPHDYDALNELVDWTQRNGDLAEFIYDLPELFARGGKERAEEREFLQENIDRTHQVLFGDDEPTDTVDADPMADDAPDAGFEIDDIHVDHEPDDTIDIDLTDHDDIEFEWDE